MCISYILTMSTHIRLIIWLSIIIICDYVNNILEGNFLGIFVISDSFIYFRVNNRLMAFWSLESGMLELCR